MFDIKMPIYSTEAPLFKSPWFIPKIPSIPHGTPQKCHLLVRGKSPSKPHQIWVPCNKNHPSPSHSASSSSPALAQHFLRWIARITNRSGIWACLRMGYLPKMAILIGTLMLNYQNWRCPIILRQTHFGWGSGIF